MCALYQLPCLILFQRSFPPPARSESANSQFPVDIKGFVCANFHLANAVAADFGVFDGRVELVAPWAAVAVAIAVVVAQQVIAAGLLAASHL